MLTVASVQAFDFQMEEDAPQKTEEDAPQNPTKKASQKVSRKKSKKPKSKAGRKAQKTNKAAKKKATQIAAQPRSNNVQNQIRLLNEKMDRLESGILSTPTSTSASSSQDKSARIPIEGTNTVIKIGGYVKADGIYDASQFTGDSSNLANLRLRNLDADSRRSNVVTAHAKQTRISLGSETRTAHGQVMAYFEGDFFGTSNIGSQAGSFNRSDTSSLNSYNFRIRHAYGSYCYDNKHRVDIGQMWSLFYDPRSAGTTIEFNGAETNAQIRRPQARYTWAHNCWKFAVSAESGATEYLDISPAFVGTDNAGVKTLTAGSGASNTTYNSSQYRRAQNSFLGGITGDGNQALPDLVAQVVYDKKQAGHVSFGVMGRQLKVNKITSTGPADPAFSGTKYGYGVMMGARTFMGGKTNLFGQLSLGHGIGAYIFGLDGYGAAIDASRGIMRTQFCYSGLVGLEHYWSDRWRSNLIFSYARGNVAGFIPSGRASVTGIDAAGQSVSIAETGYSISNMLRQFYVNLLWAPADKFEVGFEYAHFRRDTINNYFGYGNRFQFGAFYRF